MEIIWLNGEDVKEILVMSEVIDAVEKAFHYQGIGSVQMPPKVYLYFEKYNGDLRAMPAYIPETDEAGVKIVNSHPENPEKGLPTVLATYILNDPSTGAPLAIMNATYLTDIRTGAAGAVAAKYLARKDSKVLGIVGCGRQAKTQLLGTLEVFEIEKVLVTDKNPSQCQLLKNEMKGSGVDIIPCGIRETCKADIITTTTPVRKPIIKNEWVEDGAHINAIGADAPGKQELEGKILQRAKIVIDSWEQAHHSGEINVPLSSGEITEANIYGELGEIISRKKKGRVDDDEITLFDSTGLAIQDVAVAALAYKKAMKNGVGMKLVF
jgi:alanine dehydrogenase